MTKTYLNVTDSFNSINHSRNLGMTFGLNVERQSLDENLSNVFHWIVLRESMIFFPNTVWYCYDIIIIITIIIIVTQLAQDTTI